MGKGFGYLDRLAFDVDGNAVAANRSKHCCSKNLERGIKGCNAEATLCMTGPW